MKRTSLIVILFVLYLTGFSTGAYADEKSGLAGIQFGSEDFTDAENLVILDSLDKSFGESDDYGRQWAGKWEGFVAGPADGKVNFTVETDQAVKVIVAVTPVIDSAASKTSGSVSLVKGRKYPVTVTFVKTGDEYDCYMRVKWSWAGQDSVSIGSAHLTHASEKAEALSAIVQAVDDDDDDDDDDGDDDGDDDDDDEGGSLDLAEILAQKDDSANASMPGLTGIICESSDWSRPASQDIIKHTNHNWTGGPGDWSGYWQGYLEAPATGEITFIAEVDNGIRLAIGDTMIIEGLDRNSNRTGKYTMVKGKKYPLRLWYFQDGDPSYLRIYWSWAGQEKVIVDENAFSYSPSDTKFGVSKLPGEYWGDDAPFYYDSTGSEPLDLAYQDGRVNPVVGVQSYAVFRSNREHPEKYTGGMGKTYIHAPMICYWKGKYWLEFLAAPVNEHDPNTETYMTSSVDGKTWEVPKLLFPSFKPHDHKDLTICHQRMGFYVSKNDRLLIMSFYGKYPSPNEGDGIGRVVREVYEDGSVGPAYFIRFNRHAGYNESNTTVFPYYKTSPDKGFVAVCDELMANKLMVQQWWEEDRSEDGFYMLSGEEFKCKAFNWYTRKDGSVVGLFKAGYTVLSKDGGKTWSDNKMLPSVIVGHAKMWAQQTDDGRYAFVWNPHFEWRYPLVVAASDDGHTFSNMACVHGELPFMRYQGDAKDVGPQYIRGIAPGNGNPPGDDLWLAYSLHKEDIWVSRVPLPIRHKVDKMPGKETFNKMKSGGVVTGWNIYSCMWAPTEVVDFPSKSNKSLRLSDAEPYDYARAMRIFPASSKVRMKFDVYAGQNDNGRMEIDIMGYKGVRPVRIVLTDGGKIEVADGAKTLSAGSYQVNKWLKFVVTANVKTGTFGVSVDGKKVVKKAAFAEKTSDLQRLSFRTGKYRKLGIGNKENEDDLPNAGDPVKEAVFHIDNVVIK